MTQEGKKFPTSSCSRRTFLSSTWPTSPTGSASPETVQESKLYPVSRLYTFVLSQRLLPLSSALRKIETRMKAEDVADRSRAMGVKLQAVANDLVPSRPLPCSAASACFLRPSSAAGCRRGHRLRDGFSGERFPALLAGRNNRSSRRTRRRGIGLQILPDRTPRSVLRRSLSLPARRQAPPSGPTPSSASASQYAFLASLRKPD